MKKVGILTWHYYMNVGSQLQAYALQSTIEAIGAKPMIINYRNPKFGKVTKTKEYVKFVLSKTLGRFVKRLSYPYLEFQKKYLYETKILRSVESISKASQRFDYIVYGSDQIWAPNVLNTVYLGEGVDGRRTSKISYAASIGLSTIPEILLEKYKTNLADFSAISVREEQGINLLHEKCKISGTVVLDPTLLLDVSKYKEIEKVCGVPREKYLFCYFLNKQHKYKEQVLKYAKLHELTIIGISEKSEDREWMQIVSKISPIEFLGAISMAEAVCTDSYHGAIFSMLYHKELFVFERFSKDNPINQNSRIYQLDKWFNIKQRIVKPGISLDEVPEYSYEVFEKRLESLRKDSISYLKNALEIKTC